MPTLFEFFTQRGEKLPTVTERARIYEQRGLGTAAEYRGTKKQNEFLLASFQKEAPSGAISGALGGAAPSAQVSGPVSVTGGLGNFRIALKSALNEAAQARSAARIQQTFPALGGVPGTMGDIARMIRGSVAPPVESIFSDIMKEFESTREFALNMAARYPDAGISSNDTPEDVTKKVSEAPSFANQAPEVIGSATTGYLQWDDLNGAWTPVKGFPSNGVQNELTDEWIKCVKGGFSPDVCGIPKEQRAKVLNAADIPLDYSKSEFRVMIRNMKAENLDYDAIVDEINSDPDVANKEAGIFYLDQMEGIMEPTEQTYEEFISGGVPTGKFQNITLDPRAGQGAKKETRGRPAAPIQSFPEEPLFGEPLFGDFNIDDENFFINKLFR